MLRDKAAEDPSFCNGLITFITIFIYECLPPTPVRADDDDDDLLALGSQVFQPLPDPDDVAFDEIAAVHIDDIVRSRQMHSCHYTPTCFKYGSAEYHLRFPRQAFESSFIDPITNVIRVQRDDPWLNPYNPSLSLALCANHDIQFLLTKDHALAIMYYILKYISKSEQTLYSKLTVAAAVRATQSSSSPSNTSIGKQIVQWVYNKIESHCEASISEAILHLLEFPYHYTDMNFINVSTTQLLHYFKRLTDTNAWLLHHVMVDDGKRTSWT